MTNQTFLITFNKEQKKFPARLTLIKHYKNYTLDVFL